MQIRFTEKAIAELQAPENRAQFVCWDTELRGFGIVVGKRSKTFIAEARVNRSSAATPSAAMASRAKMVCSGTFRWHASGPASSSAPWPLASIRAELGARSAKHRA